MSTTLETVQGLSDSEVVEVAQELFNEVFSELPYDEVRKNSEATPEVNSLVSADEDALKHELTRAESAHLGRLVLEQYARDPELEPFVQQAVAKVQRSDKLIVDVILALGLVVSLTLLVATTKVQVQKGADGKTTWKIDKREAKPELVKAVVGPVAEAVKTATPGAL